jgi:hypothetical protein
MHILFCQKNVNNINVLNNKLFLIPGKKSILHEKSAENMDFTIF